jgi:integrase
MPKKSITSKAADKPDRPSKPYPEFPLFPHASGRWAKKIRGRFEYFGSWIVDPKGEAAGELWAQQRDDLLAGRRPRKVSEAGVTVKVACDSFLTAKEQRIASGELTRRSFDDYKATCLRIADAFGRTRVVDDLAADDFREYRAALGKTWGPVAINNEIGRVRVLFKWTYESGLIDKPVRYGPDFARPSQKTLRKARAASGVRMFEAAELRQALDTAGVQVKAMILLAINAGLGNSDCARLRSKHVDLKAGWLDFPRPKTGEPRRGKLWPETVAAVKAAIAERPEPKDHADTDLVFVTKYGRPWREDASRNSPLSHEFAKVLNELGLKRPGLNFYAIRHTLQTIGEGAGDRVALARIMGHASESSDMASVYRERIDDARLVAVSKHVRGWLFPPSRKHKAK